MIKNDDRGGPYYDGDDNNDADGDGVDGDVCYWR